MFLEKRDRDIQTGVLLLFLIAVFGCARQPPTIAFIPDETANDVWEPAHIAAAAAARGSGFRVYWNGPTRPDDVQRQLLVLNRVIQRGDQGILIVPAHSLALLTPVLRAAQKGVRIIVLGSPIPLEASANVSYIVNDEEEEGEVAARRLGERLHGKGTVAVLGVYPGTPGLFLRRRAFERALARDFNQIAIVSVRMGSNDEDQAEQIARETLQSNPYPDAIFALNRPALLGALRALRDETRTVLLVGCDQHNDVLYYLSRGRIDSVIAENAYEMGQLGIKMVIAQIHGAHTDRVTTIKPILVTRDNMYTPQLAPILIHDWRPVR
jgi:ribose transport system substrate-binding protein